MNKLFTRIMASVAGFAMAIGVGVGVGVGLRVGVGVGNGTAMLLMLLNCPSVPSAESALTLK